MTSKSPGHRVLMEQLENRRLLSSPTLLQDNFTGKSLDTAIWQQPVWNPDGSTYLGRTQLQVQGSSPSPTVSHGFLQPNLQTYNPTQLPDEPSFWGTEILSNQTFTAQPGQTLDVQFSAKLGQMPGGGVLGLFMYEMNRDGNHDELDTELVSNQTNQVETNFYADQPSDAGSPASLALPSGGSITAWHTYEMKIDAGVQISGVAITAPTITWYVDGQLIRTAANVVLNFPMNVYINFWAPDQSWSQAYNADIQPTSNSSQNQIWTAYIDNVIVSSTVDPIPPATVASAAVKIRSRDIMEDQPVTASGTVFGEGNGNIKYRWFIEEPNGNVIAQSRQLTAMMTNGVAAIPRFSGLSSDYAGAYLAWIKIVGTNVSSPARSYTVSGAAPGIAITSVPKFGRSGNAKGTVVGINPSDYAGVAVFIEVEGQWWTKPYKDAPMTTISSADTWQADIDTGGNDQDAAQIAAFLVPLGFNVPCLGGEANLPSDLFSLVYSAVSRRE